MLQGITKPVVFLDLFFVVDFLVKFYRFEKCFKELVSTTKQSTRGPDVMNKHNPTRKLEKKPCKATQTDIQTVRPDSTERSDEYSLPKQMLESFDWPEDVT